MIVVAIIALLLTLFGTHHNSLEFLFSRATAVNPLDASSADLGSGTPQPALVFASRRLLPPCRARFHRGTVNSSVVPFPSSLDARMSPP
jgi:hypothetical protein